MFTMIQQSNVLKRVNSVNSTIKVQQSRVPLLKKDCSVPQQMMEDFLDRQQLYEKINRPYQKGDKQISTSATLSQYHRFKDLVHEAKQRFQEQRQTVAPRRKEILKQQTERLRQQKMEKSIKVKVAQEKQRQLDIRILLLIIIPIVCFLTILFELL